MVRRVIDELITTFSFETDKKSEKSIDKQAKNINKLATVSDKTTKNSIFNQKKLLKQQKSTSRGFESLVSSAIDFKTVLATMASFSIASLPFKVGEEADKLIKFSNTLGVSSKDVQNLDFAMKKSGGTAEDLNSLLLKIQNTATSIVPGVYSRMFVLLKENTRKSNKEVKNTIELLTELSAKFSKLKPTTALQIGQIGGLNLAQIRFLEQGPQEVRAQLTRRSRLGPIESTKQLNQAQDFTNATTDFETAIKSLGQQLSFLEIPRLTDDLNLLAKVIGLISKEVQKFSYFASIYRKFALDFSSGNIINKNTRNAYKKVKSFFAPKETQQLISNNIVKNVFNKASNNMQNTNNQISPNNNINNNITIHSNTPISSTSANKFANTISNKSIDSIQKLATPGYNNTTVG